MHSGLIRVLASLGAALYSLSSLAQAPTAPAPPRSARDTHTKSEHPVRMRDGTNLHTAVYVPKSCPIGGAPILLMRTPYGASPYGPDTYPRFVGPSSEFADETWIGVVQDVRGRYMSEGEWAEVRPYKPGKRGQEFDESSDAYDTIAWLVEHVPCNNGRVGMVGISYPGFYAAAAMIDAHPALKAVSPQAPVADYYMGDDSYHNGAFLLAHNFYFKMLISPRGPQLRAAEELKPFDYGTEDGYRFFLDAGSLMELSRRHGLIENPYWMDNLTHTTYDEFWQARAIWRHYRKIRPAVLVVGGWYDAEDLSGTLRTFRALRSQSPATQAYLVMGPWTHGGWAWSSGEKVGERAFGEATAVRYRKQIEHRFFASILQGKAAPALPRVSFFETGSNRWLTAEKWPPRSSSRSYYFAADGTLFSSKPKAKNGHDEYVSDPAKPVPFVAYKTVEMPGDYTASDQAFAAKRADVLVYRSSVLNEDLTVRGPIGVALHVSTSGTDADFVVKVLDEPGEGHLKAGAHLLVRGDAFRGKFRKSFKRPVAFIPAVPERLRFDLPDVAHTFRKGHRIVVHVQSSWFPLFDRNPQTFTNIPTATHKEFVQATQRVYRSSTRPSHIMLPVIR
jgi:putative CocE/NonD family hydrolase